MFLSEIKKQASSFLQEKYKSARLAWTDVTQAEILTEEATNSEPWGPDTKTMTRISEASFDMDDYGRIADVLHRRLRSVNFKEWRQSYKSLVVLEFLLTHGPEDLFEEFHCDTNVIRELGKFNYVDERGFNWGSCMQKKSEKILKLLSNEDQLKEARAKALKISQEIKGFGNLIVSPSSSSPSSSKSFGSSSFGSCSSNSPTWNVQDGPNNQEIQYKMANEPLENLRKGSEKKGLEGLHLWNSPIEENGSLLESTNEDEVEYKIGSSTGFSSQIFGSTNQSKSYRRIIPQRSISDACKVTKKIERQMSLGF
ncbi:epsin-3 [Ananas comosus]|uniref:Epsin-3 n=1 Tax=Ananas comosus TaxID=4615 RepID=A0A6P5E9S5_ANACO|nr:epsin-3 [Ananas comosus]